MKSIIHRVEIQTNHETELLDITDHVAGLVAGAGVQDGVVFVLSMHTTTGITVNEGLRDLEIDIANLLHKLAPDSDSYRHARYLPSDGQMAVNATSHLRSALLGFQVFFPIENGQIVRGARHTVYFVELDGPQVRNYVVQIIGT